MGKPWVFKALKYFTPSFFSYTSLCEANQLKGKPIILLTYFFFFHQQFLRNAAKET